MPPAETVDIRPRLILPTLAARDRSSAFRELVSALVARGLIPTDLEETVLTSLEAREKNSPRPSATASPFPTPPSHACPRP